VVAVTVTVDDLVCGAGDSSLAAELASAEFERHEHAHNATASRCAHGCGPRIEAVWRRPEPGAAQRLPSWTTVG
jgi:hypothetical protein